MAIRDMLINYVPGEECRIAITEDGTLEEFYQERVSAESHVGSIYKGRVTNIESSIQAAFIDFGLERNGFLHVTDLHPMYFPKNVREQHEKLGSKTPHRERPLIQQCLRKGQEVLVQVLKEGIGTKGPTLTSYISIPGRFIVMMPHMKRLGVSRKVEDEETRREMKSLLSELDPPDGFGFIMRTAGMGQTKADLKRDLAYLVRLWKTIERRQKHTKNTGELYTESDLIIRTLRDVYSNEIDRILVDNPKAARRTRDFLGLVNPRFRTKVVFYNDPVPIFNRFDIESQINTIHSREVPLPSGGYLIIDQAEALVAIDVNSGKSRDANDAETNALHTNLEAVEQIARQLRLRDLGGVVVNDLIDMREAKHRKKVESKLRDLLKNDRARTRIASISSFGLLEMTRQRMRPSLEASINTDCKHCNGMGYVKSAESVVLEVMRRLALVMHREEVERIELTIGPDAAFQLLNRRRSQLVALERRFQKSVLVRVGGSTMDHISISAIDSRGSVLDPEKFESPLQIAQPIENAYIELDDPKLEEAEQAFDQQPEIQEDPVSQLADVIRDVSQTLADPAPKQEDKADGDAQAPATEDVTDEEGADSQKKRRRRRRRRGGGNKTEAAANTPEDATAPQGDVTDGEVDNTKPPQATPAVTHNTPETANTATAPAKTDNSNTQAKDNSSQDKDDADQPQRSKRRRRRRRSSSNQQQQPNDVSHDNRNGKPSESPAPVVSKGYSNRLTQATPDNQP